MGKKPIVVPDDILEPLDEPEDEAKLLVEEMGMSWEEAEQSLARTRARVRIPSLFDDPEELSNDE